MAKKTSSFINMTITLFLITAIAGVSLGFINSITKGPKEKARIERKMNALQTVLPAFDNNPLDEVMKIGRMEVADSLELYIALSGNRPVGTAVATSSDRGYNGTIKIMVGFTANGDINNIAVLEQKETPGLGTKIKDDSFIDQFRGKNPTSFDLRVVKDGGEVDALTGATITTRAFGEAVQLAYDALEKTPDKSRE